MKKLQASKEQDPEWIKVIAENVFNKDINKLSDGQRKMLRDLFLNNLRDGLKPKEAMEKAYRIVLSFNV